MNRTEKQQQAARENGAKSHGPVTAQGKAASAMNGTKHGLCSRDVVLPNEDPEVWEALRQAFHNHWLPANQIEALVVDDLAATQWKLLRAEAIETATLGLEMVILEPEVEKSFKRIDESSRQALAFKSLADQSKTLAALERQQTRLHRQYQRTWKQLTEIVESRPAQQPEPQQGPQPHEAPQAEQPANADQRPALIEFATRDQSRSDQVRPHQSARDEDSPPCRAA